jgi:hypothetical protein
MNLDLVSNIKSKLYNFRGHRVMLDSDLAEYYGIQTSALNRAVKRNLDRFPSDFMFQLTGEEAELLRCQNGILKNQGRGLHSKYLPHVFTEKGAWTLSFILRSKESNQKGIQLIRVLEQLRDMALQNQNLLGPSTKDLITNPTSVTNVFYAPVTIHQQGSNNQLIVNQAELILELIKFKSELNSTTSQGLKEKLDQVIVAVGKNDKPSAMKTIKSITEVAKAGSTLFKLGTELAVLIGPWLK